MDFYEIDPAVVSIAREDFSYLQNCACSTRMIVGDGRLNLGTAPDNAYGMIVLDAFSSDAVPTHLLTREAIRTYLRKLEPGGVLVFNVSNRYLDLRPMLGATAQSMELSSMTASDLRAPTRSSRPSAWVVIARDGDDLRPLRAHGDRWQSTPPNGPVWTDTYSSLFGVLRGGPVAQSFGGSLGTPSQVARKTW
jgi:spermidine synthase